MATWRISVDGGAFATFEDSGIQNPVRTVGSQVVDTFTFHVPVADWTGAPMMEEGDVVKITRDGSPFFEGRAADPKRAGEGAEERVEYKVEGPWWWFLNLTYRQTRKHRTTSTPDTPAAIDKSRVILCADSLGATISTGAEISACATYVQAASSSAFTVGTIFAGITLWPTEARAVKCAQVVSNMLSANPDAVAWFDYSTSPPTFHVQKRSALSAVTLPAESNGSYEVERATAKPRADMQSQGVLIEYETTHEYDGTQYIEQTEDAAPGALTGTEPGIIVVPVDLKGIRITLLKQKVTAEKIPDDGATDEDARAWWIERDPLLKDISGTYAAADLDFATADAGNDVDGFIWRHQKSMGGAPTMGDPDVDPSTWSTNVADYPRELTGGALAEWMAKGSGYGIVAAPVLVKVSVRIPIATLRAGPDTPLKQRALAAFTQPYPRENPTHMVYQAQFRCTGTNACSDVAPTKTYVKIADQEAGEDIPAGLAAAVHATRDYLPWEGEWRAVAQDVPLAQQMGKKLHLSGGAAEWAAMGAVIFTQTDEIDTGKTTILFGPNRRLGPQDVVQRIEAFRRNQPTRIKLEEITEGEAPADGAADVPGPEIHAEKDNNPQPPETFFRPALFIEWDNKKNDGVWVYQGNLYEIDIRYPGQSPYRHIPTVAGANLTQRRKLVCTGPCTIYLNWENSTGSIVNPRVEAVAGPEQAFDLAMVAAGGNVTPIHPHDNVYTSTGWEDMTTEIPPP